MVAYVYILASKRNGTLYTGSCSELASRIELHRMGKGSQFAFKYSVFNLVWFQEFDVTNDAIVFERRLKRWRRAWKVELIEKNNPTWRDLYPELNNLLAFI